MPRFAANTSVDSGASRAEIERTLRRYGCDEFGYMSSRDQAVILFTLHSRRVKFVLPLPGAEDEEFNVTATGRVRSSSAAAEAWEQAVRQRWRALALCVKAKLEAVEAGIETYDQAFLAHFVLPSGETVSERILPELDEAWQGRRLPALAG